MVTAIRVPPVADVSITHELLSRPCPAPDYLREKVAIQDLAQQMADHPEALLPHLVKQALEICDADAAGISVLDGEVFRWLGLVGKLAAFEGATTPRDFSPCGVCIDSSHSILMERPERIYGWIADANITVPEVLLVPLLVRGEALGTLWVVAREGQKFNRGHERVMTELAAFTGTALQMVQADVRLKKALEEQETLTQEMSHRIKNLFAITESMLQLTARNSRTKDEMTASLAGRLRALSDAHSLVRKSFDPAAVADGVDLGELTEKILRPYRASNIEGPPVHIGERSANSIALILHELATNAAKYGALSVDRGSVSVDWKVADGILVLQWREEDGPALTPPDRKGFGSALVENTVSSHGGTLDRSWLPGGLSVALRIPVDRLLR